eukprot:12399741-Karenia_brevis.AAC.1
MPESAEVALPVAIRVVERVLKAERKRYAAQREAAWDRQVRQMLQGGAGMAHRWTNAPNKPLFELTAPGCATAEQILDAQT